MPTMLHEPTARDAEYADRAPAPGRIRGGSRADRHLRTVDVRPAERVFDSVDATDSAALLHLNKVHRPVLLAYVTRLTRGDIHWAEDIVQETVLRAWRNPEARNAEGQWSRAWLFTVARRITIDHVRAFHARPAEYLDERIDLQGEQGDAFERLLNSHEVREAVAALPERWRTILIEIYFRDRSVEEAAQVLGVPTGTVKSRTFYALRALRQILIERGFWSIASPRLDNLEASHPLTGALSARAS